MKNLAKSIIKLTIGAVLIVIVVLWVFFSFVNVNAWSIGIYAGKNFFEFTPHPLVQNVQVLKAADVNDVPASFVADPFMIYDNGQWFMFFEVLNLCTEHGDIGLATSEDGLNWQYQQIVLDEDFHLSYPYIFKWNDSFYMIPESRQASSIRLYHATEFPYKWTLVSNLIPGNYADPSVVFRNDRWWMFALKECDALVLFSAKHLTGPWIEHPSSPIVVGDKNIFRPGGRHLIANNRIVRFVQDCDPHYGNSVRVFQIDTLSATDYHDHELTANPVLEASGNGWNSKGMHTIDPHQITEDNWIACVDGKKKPDLVFDLNIGAKRLLYSAKQFFQRH